MTSNTTQKGLITITGLLGWHRYGFVWSLTLLVALFSLVRPVAGRPVNQPNIVILYIDDMSEGLLASYGSNLVPTPNIDAIAIRFKRTKTAELLRKHGATGPNFQVDRRRQTVTAFSVRSRLQNVLNLHKNLNQHVEEMFPITNGK